MLRCLNSKEPNAIGFRVSFMFFQNALQYTYSFVGDKEAHSLLVRNMLTDYPQDLQSLINIKARA